MHCSDKLNVTETNNYSKSRSSVHCKGNVSALLMAVNMVHFNVIITGFLSEEHK